MPNVYVQHSPWESDVIQVSKARFWTEFEIKTSRSDFAADFRKRRVRWSPVSAFKHDMYSGESQPATRKPIAKPKHFYFVVPKGMITLADVPDHCGLICCEQFEGRIDIEKVKDAPKICGATKLSDTAIFNLAMKACYRLCSQRIFEMTTV